MAWRVVRRYERNGADECSYAQLAGLLREHDAKTIRVTVEEEVSECCEKWRGRTAETNWVNGCNYVTYRVKPAFCPECGRRL